MIQIPPLLFLAIKVVIILVVILVFLPLILRWLLMPLVRMRSVHKLIPAWYREHFVSESGEGLSGIKKILKKIGAQTISAKRTRLDRAVVLMWNNLSEHLESQGKKSKEVYISDLVECFYLFFCDLQDEYQKRPILRILFQLKVKYWVNGFSVANFLKNLIRFKPFKKLLGSRLLLRVITFPLLFTISFPLLAVSLLFQLVLTFTVEAVISYYYSLILLKAGFYGVLLLEHDHKTLIKQFSFISAARLNRKRKEHDKLMKIFFSHMTHEEEEVVAFYTDCLSRWELSGDEWFTDRKHLKIFLNRTTRALEGYIIDQKGNDLPARIEKLTREIVGKGVGPSVTPFLELTVEQYTCGAYLLSVNFLEKLLFIPGTRKVLQGLTFKFTRQSVDLLKDKKISSAISLGKQAYIPFRIYRRIRQIQKLTKFNFAGILSLSGHIAFSHLFERYKSYFIHQYGRILLFSVLNKKVCFAVFNPRTMLEDSKRT